MGKVNHSALSDHGTEVPVTSLSTLDLPPFLRMLLILYVTLTMRQMGQLEFWVMEMEATSWLCREHTAVVSGGDSH